MQPKGAGAGKIRATTGSVKTEEASADAALSFDADIALSPGQLLATGSKLKPFPITEAEKKRTRAQREKLKAELLKLDNNTKGTKLYCPPARS